MQMAAGPIAGGGGDSGGPASLLAGPSPNLLGAFPRAGGDGGGHRSLLSDSVARRGLFICVTCHVCQQFSGINNAPARASRPALPHLVLRCGRLRTAGLQLLDHLPHLQRGRRRHRRHHLGADERGQRRNHGRVCPVDGPVGPPLADARLVRRHGPVHRRPHDLALLPRPRLDRFTRHRLGAPRHVSAAGRSFLVRHTAALYVTGRRRPCQPFVGATLFLDHARLVPQVVGFVMSFGVGLGPVPWLLPAELFAPDRCALGASVSAGSNWMANFVVGQAFMPLSNALKSARPRPPSLPLPSLRTTVRLVTHGGPFEQVRLFPPLRRGRLWLRCVCHKDGARDQGREPRPDPVRAQRAHAPGAAQRPAKARGPLLSRLSAGLSTDGGRTRRVGPESAACEALGSPESTVTRC